MRALLAVAALTLSMNAYAAGAKKEAPAAAPAAPAVAAAPAAPVEPKQDCSKLHGKELEACKKAATTEVKK